MFLCKFRGRDPIKMPKMDLKAKLAKVKMVRMPSPGEIAGGIKDSLSVPLACRTRVENVEVQKARQLLTQQKTPSELGNLRHPLVIPLPKLRSSSKKEEEQEAYVLKTFYT